MDENAIASLTNVVTSGNIEKVKELIGFFNFSYSKKQSDGYVLLCLAIENNQTEIAELLIKKGCEVNNQSLSKSTDTPLHYAIKNYNLQIVEILLEYGANVNTGILSLAIKKGNEVIVDILLKRSVFSNPEGINKLLYLAFNEGDSEILNYLLKYEASIKSVCIKHYLKGCTDLHLAAGNGNKEIVELLVSNGYCVNAKTEYLVTPLHIAAEKGHSEIVEYLIKNGAEINSYCIVYYFHPSSNCCVCRNSKSVYSSELYHGNTCPFAECPSESNYVLRCCTPLQLAAEKNCENVVSLLLDLNANVDAVDQNGVTALQIAVVNRNIGICEVILNHCPDKDNESNKRSLKIAVLQEYNCKYNKNKLTLNKRPHKLEVNYSLIVKKLLLYGFTIDRNYVNDHKLLCAAVKLGHINIVADLLKFGADIKSRDEMGKSPIFYAVENNDLEMTKLLLTNGACVRDDLSILFNAVRESHIDIVQLIYQYNNIDINLSDKDGNTALHLSAGYPALRPSASYPALHPSASYRKRRHSERFNESVPLPRNIELLRFFVNKGANVNAKTKTGLTALHVAISTGFVDGAELLLEYGSDIDSRDINNETPLYKAVKARRGSHDNCTEILLRFGANTELKNNEGKTVLNIATTLRASSVVNLLLSYGADINCVSKSGLTCDFNFSTGINKVLKQHIVKMKCLNLNGCEKRLLSLKTEEYLLEESCLKEVELLKSYKINNNESFYSVLSYWLSKRIPENQLAVYANNKTLEQLKVFRTESFNHNFLLYGNFIKCFFRRAFFRKHLLENCYELLYSHDNKLSVLPHECLERIFMNLSNDDLKALLRTCNLYDFKVTMKQILKQTDLSCQVIQLMGQSLPFLGWQDLNH